MRTKLLYCLLLFPTMIISQSLVRKFEFQIGNQIYNLGSSAPIIQTSDGGYLLNYSYSYPDYHGGPIYSTLIKTNSNFLPIWKKDLFVSNGKKTFTFDDGTIILFENAQSYYSMSFNLEKLNSNGSTIWKKNEYEISPNKITIRDAYIKNNNII